MNIKPTVTLFVLICVIVVFATACSNDNQEQQDIQQQTTAPESKASNVKEDNADTQAQAQPQAQDFTLKDLQGNTINLSDYRGKWVVVNYWATWCPPCREEIPYFVKIQEDREDVQILGIAYEDAPIEKLQQFAEDFSVNYPILTVDVYNPPAYAEAAGEVLPTTVFYNPKGQIHKTRIGPIDYDTLQQLTQ